MSAQRATAHRQPDPFIVSLNRIIAFSASKKTARNNSLTLFAVIRSTFIASTDFAIAFLVIASSRAVMRPKPRVCFVNANALSTAILSVLSLYAIFRFPSHHRRFLSSRFLLIHRRLHDHPVCCIL